MSSRTTFQHCGAWLAKRSLFKVCMLVSGCIDDKTKWHCAYEAASTILRLRRIHLAAPFWRYRDLFALKIQCLLCNLKYRPT
jgi:hypothetical protein